MIQITNKKNCCGCGACAQICGKSCINMQEDSEGFLYPVIDSDKCVDCGACERVCPIRKHPIGPKSIVDAFVAYANDREVREASSSGGMFSLLAEEILNEGGVVFGAAFDEDFMVHHLMAEYVDQLPQLRGSKYLQSRTETTFIKAEENLKKGRPVLYVGTECQIAGLKKYLGREYDGLYTADVLCHGVPSSDVWKKYVQFQEARHSSKLSGVSFRKKTTGWKNYSVELKFENGSVYSSVFKEDPYMRFFLGDICLRPSCYKCQFKSIPRTSDLTIGDAWGIGKWMQDMDDDQGTSVVIINSVKGQELWNKVLPQIKVKHGEIDRLIPPKSDSRKPVRAHCGRRRFFTAVQNGATMPALERIVQNRPVYRLTAKLKKWIRIGLHKR